MQFLKGLWVFRSLSVAFTMSVKWKSVGLARLKQLISAGNLWVTVPLLLPDSIWCYLLLYALSAVFCRVFGHFSHRSEWQLVKVDYKSIFDRRCAEEDYRPWQLHSQVRSKEAGIWPEVANDPTVKNQHDPMSFPFRLVYQIVPYWMGLFCYISVLASDCTLWAPEDEQLPFGFHSPRRQLAQTYPELRNATTAEALLLKEAWTPSVLHLPSNFPVLISLLFLHPSLSSDPVS